MTLFARLAITAAVAAAWLPMAHAQQWSAYANISETMGTNAGRLCMAEASRGDIGCPIYAPYVSSTSGNVGINQTNPQYKLDVQGSAHLGTSTVYSAASPLLLSNIGGQDTYLRMWQEGIASLGLGSRANDTNLYLTNAYSHVFGTPSTSIILTTTGRTGIGAAQPSTTLHVSGTLRIASGGEARDAHRAGAIRYVSGNFQVCYGSGGWANLADASGTVPVITDRIISGTTSVTAAQDGSVTVFTGGTERMVIGQNGYVGVNATILNAPLTISSSHGAAAIGFGPGSAYKIASHAGGGPFIQGLPYVLIGNITGSIGAQFSTGYTGQPQLTLYPIAGQEGLRVRKAASSNVALVVSPSGYVGINTALPTTELEVSGTVSATTMKLADSPDATCGPAAYGTFKVMNGRPYFCRP